MARRGGMHHPQPKLTQTGQHNARMCGAETAGRGILTDSQQRRPRPINQSKQSLTKLCCIVLVHTTSIPPRPRPRPRSSLYSKRSNRRRVEAPSKASAEASSLSATRGDTRLNPLLSLCLLLLTFSRPQRPQSSRTLYPPRHRHDPPFFFISIVLLTAPYTVPSSTPPFAPSQLTF
jgi:hypothetical protein